MNLKLAEKIDAVKKLSIEELCEKFNCSPEEICFGDYIARETSDTVCPYKVILGFANFEHSQVKDLGPLEIVYGKKLKDNIGEIRDMQGNPIYLGVNFANSLVKYCDNLRIVYGSIDLGKNITSLGNIQFLGSNLYLGKTNLTSLGKLEIIDGIFDIERSKLISFGKLRKIGTFQIGSQKVYDFENIEEVGSFIVKEGVNNRTMKLIKREFKMINNRYCRSKMKEKEMGFIQ